MRDFTVYNAQTGAIEWIGSCSDSDFYCQGGPGLLVIEGHYSVDTHYIASDNTPVAKSIRPNDDHKWDYAAKAWVLDQEKVSDKDKSRKLAAEEESRRAQHEAEHAFIRKLMKS